MKHWTIPLSASTPLCAGNCFTPQLTQEPAAPYPYQPTLTHLLSLTREQITDWHSHPYVARPEDSSLDDAAWETIKIGDASSWMGARVLRREIEIPENINSHATKGSRASLDLRFVSRESLYRETS